MPICSAVSSQGTGLRKGGPEISCTDRNHVAFCHFAEDPCSTTLSLMDSKSNVLVYVENVFRYFPVKRNIADVFLSGQTYVRAVDGVSIEIRNEKSLMVGESGCGKSTLGRLLAFLDSQTRG